MTVYAPRRGPAWWERLVDWLYGPREWSVVRDGFSVITTEVYACLTSRTVLSDTLLAVGLREREARAYARRHQPPPPQHVNCRCSLTRTP